MEKVKVLTIVGAGASYDYALLGGPGKGFRPPLANDLFIEDRYRPKWNARYPRVADLASEVQPRILSGEYVESVLQDQQKSVSIYPEVKLQLIQTQFYLREIFEEVSNGNYIRSNNYSGLMGIFLSLGIIPLFVSYNYDTLLERTLEDRNLIKFTELDSFISNEVKIIKPHGSENWGYYQPAHTFPDFKGDSLLEFALEHPTLIDEYQELNAPSLVRFGNTNWSNEALPALAIPLPTKNFICPQSHIEKLQSELNDVKRILIIGWKGMDKSILEMVKTLDREIEAFVITSKASKTDEIKKTFNEYNINVVHHYSGGFAEMIGRPDILKDFLKKK